MHASIRTIVNGILVSTNVIVEIINLNLNDHPNRTAQSHNQYMRYIINQHRQYRSRRTNIIIVWVSKNADVTRLAFVNGITVSATV